MANRVVPDRQGLINIGKLKENLVTEVELPAPGFAGGSYAVLLQRPREKQPYPVTARTEGGRLIWTVQTADTAIPGTGRLECRRYGDNGEVDKSQTYTVRITDGLPDPTEAPEAYAGYVAQVARNAEAAKSAASVAGDAAGRAETALKALEDGIASGDFRGEKGEKGDTGPQGPKGEAGPAGDTTAADAAAEAAKEAAQEAQKAAEDCAGTVNELKSDIAAVAAVCGTLENTEDGTMIQLTDCAERPLKGLRIFGRTTQDGTPTPETPVPLESVGESVKVIVYSKNLFALAEPGSINTSGQEITVANDSARRTPYIKCEPGEKYAFSKAIEFTETYENGVLRCFDADKNFTKSISALKYNAKSKIVTIPSGIAYFRFVQFGYGRYENVDLQIEKGDTVTEYEDVSGNSLTISTPNGLPGIPVTSGGNYTDANGQQWICDEVDFARGVYVRRCGVHTFDGSATDWEVAYQGTEHCSAQYKGLKSVIKTAITNDIPADILCSHYKVDSASVVYSHSKDKIVAVNMVGEVLFYDSAFVTTTVDIVAFAASMAGVKIIYALASPIETAIDSGILAAYAALHTYKPNTTIYNDAGAQMEVSYHADTKLYIDKQFAELRNAIVSLGGNV